MNFPPLLCRAIHWLIGLHDVFLEVCDGVSAKLWVLADAGDEFSNDEPFFIIGTYLMTRTLASWINPCPFLAAAFIANGAMVVASAVCFICRQCVDTSLL